MKLLSVASNVVFGVAAINIILEEVVIPWAALKRPQERAEATGSEETELGSEGFDVVLTEKEREELVRCGARDILNRGVRRHVDIAMTGQIPLCSHCGRLEHAS
jgi:hypothetical protein